MPGDDRFRNGKGVGIDLVEAVGNIAAYLDVLLLVDADRHDIGLIQQDIRRHQHRIGEQPGVDVVGVLCALVLELRHAGKLTEHGEAVEQPCQLGVLRHVRLDVQCVAFGVKPARKVKCQRFIGAAAQFGGDLPNRNGMLVHYAVKALVFFGKSGKIPQCAKIIAERQVSAGLNARKGYRLILEHG